MLLYSNLVEKNWWQAGDKGPWGLWIDSGSPVMKMLLPWLRASRSAALALTLALLAASSVHEVSILTPFLLDFRVT